MGNNERENLDQAVRNIILMITDQNAPNVNIVCLRRGRNGQIPDCQGPNSCTDLNRHHDIMVTTTISTATPTTPLWAYHSETESVVGKAANQRIQQLWSNETIGMMDLQTLAKINR